MPLSNQDNGNIEDSIIRFGDSTAGKSKPTHYKRDSSLETTVTECFERYIKDISYVKMPGDAYFEHSIKTTRKIGNAFQATGDGIPKAREQIHKGLESLERDHKRLCREATYAHMRNEEYTRRTAMINRIKWDLFKEILIVKSIKHGHLIYAAVIVCEMWGLELRKRAICDGILEDARSDELWQCGYAKAFLILQIRDTLFGPQGVSSLGVHLKDAEWSLGEWQHCHEITMEYWDHEFDEAVVFRAYEQSLRMEISEVEMEMDRHPMLLAPDMTAAERNARAAARLVKAREQLHRFAIRPASAKVEREAYGTEAKQEWAEFLAERFEEDEEETESEDTIADRQDFKKYVVCRRMKDVWCLNDRLIFDEERRERVPMVSRERSKKWWAERMQNAN